MRNGSFHPEIAPCPSLSKNVQGPGWGPDEKKISWGYSQQKGFS